MPVVPFVIRRMNFSKVWTLLFVGASTWAQAQFTYTTDQSIVVQANGRQQVNAWAGGLNSAQVNTMDVNGDTRADLVVFDKSANKLLIFVQQDGRYAYAPEYEVLFPPVTQWVLLRDFNHDGRKDIFTSNPFGISVFVNTTPAGQLLRWRKFNGDFPLLTKGFSGNINLKVNESDIPAIDDIDGDGDLDIVNMRFVGVGTAEFHKNMAKEQTGRTDTLIFERVTQRFGNFEECNCGQFAFGSATCPQAGGRTQHAGGKTLLTLDVDGDGDKDLVITEESCARLYLLTNKGTPAEADMVFSGTFPATTPVNFLLFPGAFLEDVDFDGLPDLVASPNLNARTFLNNPFERSVWFYKNAGTATRPVFTFVKTDFLQEDMIDVGDFSAPAFADLDGDGDSDMLIGNYAGDGFIGRIYYYENTGTNGVAAFKLVTPDFASLTGMNQFNIKPMIADMNADGKPDLAFTSTSRQSGQTILHYFVNRSASGITTNAADLVSTSFSISQSENLAAADVNQDGLVDLLYGRATGALEYWQNTGDSFVLRDAQFLGIAQSVLRQNPAVAVADLDADGRADLVLADQKGALSIYGDFRQFDPAVSVPRTNLLFNELTQQVVATNLGGRLRPAIANLFNSDKPAIVVGNTLGGLMVLRNNEGAELPAEPVISVFPNPLLPGDHLNIQTDRNALVQIFSLMGQKMNEPVFVGANEVFPLTIQNIAAGLYIVTLTTAGKTYARKVVIR